MWYFNPLAPRGARRDGLPGGRPNRKISIHSLRGERDSKNSTGYFFPSISIHSLRVGARPPNAGPADKDETISIHSLCVGARLFGVGHDDIGRGISIHSLRVRARPDWAYDWLEYVFISIHSLRVRARQQTPTKRQAFFHHNNTTSTNKCQTVRSIPPFLPLSPTPLSNFSVRRSRGSGVCLGFAQKAAYPREGRAAE